MKFPWIAFSCLLISTAQAADPHSVKMPAGVNPGLANELKSVSQTQAPFADKKILQVSVTTDFGATYRDGNAIQYRQAVATIAVFDPKNSKCWLWKTVQYRKHAPSTEIEQYVVDYDANAVFEMDCKNVSGGGATGIAANPPAAAAPGPQGQAQSGIEGKLAEISRSQAPFADKKILSVKVLTDFGATYRDNNLVPYRQLVASVTVFDPKNSKCWLWKTVQYRKHPPGDEIEQYVVDYDGNAVAEVPCK